MGERRDRAGKRRQPVAGSLSPCHRRADQGRGGPDLPAPRIRSHHRGGAGMSASRPLPRAAAPLLGFARLLRRFGFAVAPEQGAAFMQAVTLLGPRSMADIREAALATLAPPPDRRGEFDALFRSWFHGEEAVATDGESDEETQVRDDGGEREQQGEELREEEGGELSSAIEQLSLREFRRDDDTLTAFRRALPAALPARRSF